MVCRGCEAGLANSVVMLEGTDVSRRLAFTNSDVRAIANYPAENGTTLSTDVGWNT